MKILVVSKVSIPAKDRTLPAWEHLRSLGHTVVVEHPDSVPTNERPDALISMGVSIMEETFAALDRFPGVPLFAYNWDCYSWVWEVPGRVQAYHPMRGKEYDYVRYGELLLQAREVWVPSVCTGRQTSMWWSVHPDRWHVILSSCPWWDRPDVEDGGYALCTLRHLPDRMDRAFEENCKDLGIPFLRSDHNLSREDYERAVARCRFLVSHYDEASTGGLTLLEGYRLGKPVLLSDSPWHGGKDYFGDRAMYFCHRDPVDFRAKLIRMHENTCWPEPAEARRWIEDRYSDQRMVEHMVGRIEACAR